MSGSLYRVLDAPARDGLIEDDRTETVNGLERKYYRLTPAGEGDLTAAIEALEVVAKTARARMKEPRPIRRTPEGGLA